MQTIDLSETIPYSAAEAVADEFEGALAEHGITVASGSALEHGSLVIAEMRRRHERPNESAPWMEMGVDLQVALGTLHLMRLVLRSRAHPEFERLVPHLRLLSDGNPTLTQAAEILDSASNKIFELLIALAALDSGTDLDLDDPISSSGGDNPDILIRMQDSLKWGFACKVMSGESPKTLFERLLEGAKQIDRSSADVGLVVVSLKNCLLHQDFLPTVDEAPDGSPILGVHQSNEEVQEKLVAFHRERVRAMINAVGQEEVLKAAKGSRALPAILCPAMAAVGVQSQVGPVTATIGFLIVNPLDLDSSERPWLTTHLAVLEQLNRGFHVA